MEKGTSASVQLTMEPEMLTTVIGYIYTGEVDLTVDNVDGLVKACDVLQLKTLTTACEDFMMKHVDQENCFRFYQFAATYHLANLKRNAKRVILSEFKALAFVDEFKKLSCTDLIEIIKDDDVNVECDDVVFESVLAWACHDLQNRKASFEAILEHVRLPYCSPNYLRHVKDKADLFTAKCFEYLHEAVVFQADAVHQHEISSCRTMPRTNFRGKSRLLVVGGLNDVNEECNHCRYYREDTGCWESLTELPESVRWLYSVSRVDRGLLVTGGYDNDKAHDQCWLFDVVTRKWEAMPPLMYARYFHRSVSLGDCVYVVGGKVDDKVFASVESLDLNRRQWSCLSDMSLPVRSPMVVTYSNKIFVFGGQDVLNNDLCSTQVFDTTKNLWSTRSDMPEVCCLGAAVTLNDCIYVVGGFDRRCLKYDPASDTWASLSRPVLQHGYGPAVVWRGSILVSGGRGGDSKLSVTEQYDPIADSWSTCSIAQLDEPMYGHCLFNIDLYL